MNKGPLAGGVFFIVCLILDTLLGGISPMDGIVGIVMVVLISLGLAAWRRRKSRT